MLGQLSASWQQQTTLPVRSRSLPSGWPSILQTARAPEAQPECSTSRPCIAVATRALEYHTGTASAAPASRQPRRPIDLHHPCLHGYRLIWCTVRALLDYHRHLRRHLHCHQSLDHPSYCALNASLLTHASPMTLSPTRQQAYSLGRRARHCQVRHRRHEHDHQYRHELHLQHRHPRC